MTALSPIKRIRTETLEIAYEEAGPADGKTVILMHGFPDDPRIWDGVVTDLAANGYHLFTPYLRGYGPTRFRKDETPRSGQQAALGQDLLDFMNALNINRAILVGYDWGGRACCIVAALWPDRVERLVSIGGYNIQNIPESHRPESADLEHRYWYQWYSGAFGYFCMWLILLDRQLVKLHKRDRHGRVTRHNMHQDHWSLPAAEV